MALFSELLSIEGKSLRRWLSIISSLLFVLPFMIFTYLLYIEGLFQRFNFIYIPLLILSLTGLIILRQIFDKFIMVALFIKKAEAGERVTMEIQKGAAELKEISFTFNALMKRLEETEKSLEEHTKELKESETRFRGIVEAAKDAMVCIEEGGIIYLWNKGAEEMFGYNANEAIGKDIHSLIVPERFREKANEGFKAFLQTGMGPIIGKTIELIGLKKGGAEFPVEISVSAMNIKDKWHATGIIRDITARKEAEKKIAEQMDFLERFHKAAVQRELRIKELKERVKELEEELKKIRSL